MGVQSSLTESCNSASLTENDRPELHTKTATKVSQRWRNREEQELRSAESAGREYVTQMCHTLAENAQDGVDVCLQVWRESIDFF
jgi:hypothetical protein